MRCFESEGVGSCDTANVEVSRGNNSIDVFILVFMEMVCGLHTNTCDEAWTKIANNDMRRQVRLVSELPLPHSYQGLVL